MAEITVLNIKKAFEEGKDILDGLTFSIDEGERVGLLGKNGAGKTTLFRILSGECTQDEGEIALVKGRRLGLISQIPVYPEQFTTEDVLVSAQKRVTDIRTSMQALEERMARGASAALLKEYDALAYAFERAGGWDLDFERNRVANGLEIPQQQRNQLFSTLSGGEKTRVNLARLILEDTDILLLDEPTNHLDINATEWLEDYLKKFKGTVVVISHDRYFLDSVVNRTIEIVDGKAVFYSGNYSFYVAEKKRRYEQQLKKYEREQSEAKRLGEAADRLYQWGTGNKNLMKKSFAIQSRIERIATTERPTAEKNLRARFYENTFKGDEVFSVKGVSKTFEGRTLFSDVELTVRGGERIALIGDNGTGKTTLLNVLLDEARPDTGSVKTGPSVKAAYMPQIIRFAHPERSLADTLIYETGCTMQTARNRLGAYKFSGEDVFKRVGDLSGGELSRLRLCMLMSEEINFLVLDEPTNHLDIASREWIEEALGEYKETLLFVSHDRYFVNRFATRVWELENGRITDFMGSYESYRKVKNARITAQSSVKTERTEKKKKPVKSKSAEKQASKLEREIAALEKQLRELGQRRDAFCADYEKLMEIDAEEAEIKTQLDDKYDEWAMLLD